MENNWKEVKLGKFIKVKHGFAFPGTHITDQETDQVLVTPGNFHIGGGFKNNKFKYFTSNDYPESYILKEGDIVVTMTDLSKESDTLGYGAKIPRNNKVKFLHNQRVGLVEFKDEKEIHYDFVYWVLRTRSYQGYVVGSASGTSIMHTSPSRIEDYDFFLPPLPEQKAIASVLSSLDDKIDLLYQQNQTLEALAETLYLNFIGEREFNSKLSDIFSLQNGYAFKSKSFKDLGTIRVIKIKNISGNIVDITNSDFVDDESIKKLDVKFKINSGDIIIAMTGAEVGKLGIVPVTTQNLWLNQRVGLLKEKIEGAKYLAYLHLKSDFGQDYIENTATGSAQPNISGDGIENCEFPSYEETELREICNKLSPLYDKVIFNLGQIQTLNQLRDTLLPKLMNGEVRVKI